MKMNVKDYYVIWINKQSQKFIDSDIWKLEEVLEFAEDYKSGKFLNEKTLASDLCDHPNVIQVRWAYKCIKCGKLIE